MRPRTRAAGVIACAALAACAVTAAAVGWGGSSTVVIGGEIGEPQEDHMVQPELPDPAITPGSGGIVPAKADGLTPSGAIRELRAAPKPPALRVDSGGRLRTVAAPAGQPLKPVPGTPKNATPEQVARKFVDRYAPAFGITSTSTVDEVASTRQRGGDTIVRYNQTAGGVPVLGGQLVVSVNAKGIVGATAEATPVAPLATKATVAAGTAARTAVTAAAARYKLDADSLHADKPKLWLYDPRLVDGPGAAQLRPTWQVTVHDTPGEAGHGVGDVYVDGLSGKVTVVIDGHREARDRVVCDLKNAVVDLSNRETYRCDDFAGGPAVVRREGGAASSVPDANTLYDNLAKVYDFYKNKLGRDSFDGFGGQIKATVRACDIGYECPYQNAFWEGTQFVFGEGTPVEDVTAHEFTHGVTEHTSNLWYWRQAGAINEALSDIFGQFVDLQTPADDVGANHWAIGEGSSLGVIRDMADPTVYPYLQPDRYTSPLWDNDVTGEYDGGGVHVNSGVANKAAQLLVSGGSFNGRTIASIGSSEANAIDKSATLWYRVENTLVSGADYRDLAATLSAACRALIGYQGFTATNCAQVDLAVAATEMDMAPETGSHGAAEAPVCPSPGQPVSKLFYDGMERPTAKWARSNTFTWAYAPSSVVQYSYAAAGKGSLNGWTAPGTNGNGTTAELRTPITLPAGTSYLRFAHALDTESSGGIQVQVNVNNGGWTNLTAPSTGIPVSGGRISATYSDYNLDNVLVGTTQGFGSTRFDLSGYAGQQVRFRFRVDAPSNQRTDWYVDEFTVYQCTTGVGQPRNLAAKLTADKTGANVTWDAPQYAGPGIAGYEVTVTPAPASGSSVVTTTGTSYALAGLDPNRTYRVSVRAYDASGNFGTGVLVQALSGPPPTGCGSTCPPQPGEPPRAGGAPPPKGN